MTNEKLSVLKEDVLMLKNKLEGIAVLSEEENVKVAIEELLKYIAKNILISEVPQKNFEEVITEKMQAMRDVDKELYNLLYFLYRNYENKKLDEVTAWEMLNKYIKAISLRYNK